MVEVTVADEEDLRVGVFEAEGFDRLFDLWWRGLKVGVDEDVALRGNDEVGGEILRADVVKIANDLEGREGLDPGWV